MSTRLFAIERYDDTGAHVTPIEPFPALTVDCITSRKKPIFPAIVVGRSYRIPVEAARRLMKRPEPPRE